jgi:uncharacterized protein (DUF885 family)
MSPFVPLFAAPLLAVQGSVSQANPAQSTAASGGADQALSSFYRRYLDSDFAQRPLQATRCGDHRFDAQIDDLSAPARGARLVQVRQALDALPRAVDYEKLTRPAQIDFEILRDALAVDLWQSENLKRFESDPRVYGDYTTECVFLLLTQSSLPKADNIEHAIARMKQVPRVLADARANLCNPPRVVAETAIKQNLGAIVFYEREVFQLAGEATPSEALKAAAKEAADALRQHQQFLEKELLPRANGEWRIGKARFAEKFERELAAGVTADQNLADAEAEFERVTCDMYVLARQLWSSCAPKVPLPPEDAAGRRETIQRVLAEISRNHAEPQALVSEAQATVSHLKRFIADKGLLLLPEPDRCQIREMQEFLRGNSIADLRCALPLDPDMPSLYSISPPPKEWPPERIKSFVEEYNRQALQVLTIHEAYPGHYVQLHYANRNPSLIRRVVGSDVFAEGWAVYCEKMMLDEGYGGGDLALRLAGLKFYLRAVANSILDYKMHCASLSDEEALRFLTEDAFQAEGEARLKVIRSKQSSVQLSSYFVGRMAFARLRQQVQREMGEAFSLSRFNQALLEGGSVPVRYLPEVVRMTMKEGRHEP